MNKQQEQTNRAQAFVDFIIGRIEDKGNAAKLRRADNPATEYQSWDVLAAFHIQLDKSYERLPYAAIAAAIAKEEIQGNGHAGIGQAIASCYDDGNESDQAKAKLRRLLACESTEEVCRILRSLFSLIHAKSNLHLDFSRLLNELLKFNVRKQQIKSRWAQDFYQRTNNIVQEDA